MRKYTTTEVTDYIRMITISWFIYWRCDFFLPLRTVREIKRGACSFCRNVVTPCFLFVGCHEHNEHICQRNVKKITQLGQIMYSIKINLNKWPNREEKQRANLIERVTKSFLSQSWIDSNTVTLRLKQPCNVMNHSSLVSTKMATRSSDLCPI